MVSNHQFIGRKTGISITGDLKYLQVPNTFDYTLSWFQLCFSEYNTLYLITNSYSTANSRSILYNPLFTYHYS